MMTLEELSLADVDYDVAREALTQSEKRLGDALETKKSVEQKATVLFGGYVTITLALFGVGGALAKDSHLMAPALPFFAAGAIFLLGALSFVFVFRSANYGNLGSEPSMWLQPGRIDGGKRALARMLSYLAYHHSERIEISYRNNAKKSAALHFGMSMGPAALAVLVIGMAVTYGPWTSHP